MGRPTGPACVRCTHPAFHHRLNDALGLGPGDPHATFRCIWPILEPGPPYEASCTCPDMVVPPDAGWPYNGAAPPEPV